MKNQFIAGFLALINVLLLIACGAEVDPGAVEQESELRPPAIAFTASGKIGGKQLETYTLTNGRGVMVRISNFGGTITSIMTPDRQGQLEEITLGFDTIIRYIQGSPYFGAVVGRYGNRIAKGQFTLDGQAYTLATNNMGNHLHGGLKGFDKVLWKGTITERNDLPILQLKYSSADGEEGYPGKLDVTVSYSLNQDNELNIDYRATTDKPTVVNLTNHTYFNLAGNAERDILDHTIMINADRFVPVNETLIPTGELTPVTGTPFDFTEPKTIGQDINAEHEQLQHGGGYDHCWVLNRSPRADGPTLAARVTEPTSGRLLEVYTTEPGVQFYTGNFLDGNIRGIGGAQYNKRYGFCLETEHFPDSPNQPDFPSTVLRPGEVYQTTTTFKFGVQ